MSKKCTKCKIQNTSSAAIPLVSAECEATRQHSIIKRLICVIVLLTVLLFGSNLAWVIYESQFETVIETTTETYEVVQDTERGSNNCVINRGEITNGEADY